MNVDITVESTEFLSSEVSELLKYGDASTALIVANVHSLVEAPGSIEHVNEVGDR